MTNILNNVNGRLQDNLEIVKTVDDTDKNK